MNSTERRSRPPETRCRSRPACRQADGARGDARGAFPLFKRALTLDPNFAEAHDNLAWVYVNLGDQRSAAQSAEKAFALRDRVTELEKFYVTDTYHHWATVFPSQRPREKPFHIVTPSPGRGRASIAITRNYRIIDRNFEVFEWDCWFDQDSDKYKDAIPK